MPTKPPVAIGAPARMRRTASSALTIFPVSGARSCATGLVVAAVICFRNAVAMVCSATLSPALPLGRSVDTGQVVESDDEEHRRGLGQGDHENDIVGLAVGEGGDDGA